MLLHTHVIRTTTDKLASTMDDVLTEPDDYETIWQGGRDWVIITRHAHDPKPPNHTHDKRRPR